MIIGFGTPLGGTGFFGIIGNVPAGALEMETALGNQFVHFPRTMRTASQRPIGHFLKYFFNVSTFGTLIFVYRHFRYPPAVFWAVHIKSKTYNLGVDLSRRFLNV